VFQQNLCSGIIDLDAEIPDRALDLEMAEQKLDAPKVFAPISLPLFQGQKCCDPQHGFSTMW
jgi:hypothetical protein